MCVHACDWNTELGTVDWCQITGVILYVPPAQPSVLCVINVFDSMIFTVLLVEKQYGFLLGLYRHV